MEVLNQNQRKSNLTRLFALGGVIVVLLGTGVFAMHEDYASQDADQLSILSNQHNDELILLDQSIAKLKNEKNKLKRENEKLRDQLSNNEALKDCQEELEKKIEEWEEEKEGREKYYGKWEECMVEKRALQ